MLCQGFKKLLEVKHVPSNLIVSTRIRNRDYQEQLQSILYKGLRSYFTYERERIIEEG